MGSTRTTAVFGIYEVADSAEVALDDLLQSGFTCTEISILLPDNENARAFVADKCAKAHDSSASGGHGLLAGLCEFAIPGVGPIIAGGPILAAITGIAAGGTLGGLVGELIGMGIPEYEAKLYEGAVKDGGALLSIHCEAPGRVPVAKSSLERTGARDIASTSEVISKEVEGDCLDCGKMFDGRDLLAERAG